MPSEQEELRLSVSLIGNDLGQLDRRRDFPPSWPLLTFSKDNKR
jgi:hypothetical protein